jgi:predicted secreted Zn-dependent protease
MKRAWVLSLAIGLCAAGSASSGEIKERTTYFMVKGQTLADLNSSFGQGGPMLGSGERHGGATQVMFGGDATYAEVGGTCRVDRAAFRLNLVTTLPRWSPPADATPEMKVVWRTLRNDVATHEAKHAEIAKRWLRQLETRVKALSPEPTCAAMKARVAMEKRDVLRQHDLAQVDFDRHETSRVDARVEHQLSRNLGRFTLR